MEIHSNSPKLYYGFNIAARGMQNNRNKEIFILGTGVCFNSGDKHSTVFDDQWLYGL